MNILRWFGVAWVKTFIWCLLLCVAIGFVTLFATLSLTYKVVVGGFLLLLVGMYVYERLAGY